MTPGVRQLIDDLDRRLIRSHRFDIELFDRLREKQRAGGILHGSRTICPFLRPFFLEASRYRRIRIAASHVSAAINTVTRAALQDDEMLRQLGVTEKEELWARLDPGYEDVSVTSRLDAYLSRDGFAFLEYNGENPAGVGDHVTLGSLHEHVPAVCEFLSDVSHFIPKPQVSLVETILSTYRQFGGKDANPNVAIVDWEGVDTTAEFELLAGFFEARGLKTIISDPHELEYAGDTLRVKDFNIDVLFKRVIIHEFLEKFDESSPVFRALQDGNVCMINAFRSKIAHKKANFAILTDERYSRMFTSEQLAMIDAHVPWTRRVLDADTTCRGKKIDLLQLLSSERHRFVLKPNDDYGGHGITLGWESSESDWDAAIEKALTGEYIVQERVAVDKVEMPVIVGNELHLEQLNVDFDPFLFCGSVDGGMVRFSKDSLVNITQGGMESALVILNDY